MKYSRREFLGLASAAPLALLSQRYSSFNPDGIKALRGDVGIYLERGGTIGWLANREFLIVVDTQFPDTAEHFANAIKARNEKNIDVLFNTHHHGDHTSGNQFLGPMTDILVAHKNVPELQRRRYAGTEDEAKQVYADTTFEDFWDVDTGSERITARHFGPGHTGGDAIIHFEKANVIHMGDLVFNNVYPFIDVDRGDASIDGWISVLGQALDFYPKDGLYIFGHSVDDSDVTGSTDALVRMRDYLTALREHVTRHKKTGKSVDEIVAAGSIPKFGHLKERWEGAFRHNIEAAFKTVGK